MALDRLNDDMNFVAGLGDDPKRDDGLSTPQFKSYFDKAGLLIQNFINNKLIPQIESAIDEGALLVQITEAMNRKLDKSGGKMTGDIDMNSQRITGLPTPLAENEPVTKKFATDYVKNYVKDYVYGEELTATLRASTWLGSEAPYTQTVSVEGILAEDNPDYWPIYSGNNDECIAQKEAFAHLDRLVTADGIITVTCFEDKPEVDVTIGMEVHR